MSMLLSHWKFPTKSFIHPAGGLDPNSSPWFGPSFFRMLPLCSLPNLVVSYFCHSAKWRGKFPDILQRELSELTLAKWHISAQNKIRAGLLTHDALQSQMLLAEAGGACVLTKAHFCGSLKQDISFHTKIAYSPKKHHTDFFFLTAVGTCFHTSLACGKTVLYYECSGFDLLGWPSEAPHFTHLCSRCPGLGGPGRLCPWWL